MTLVMRKFSASFLSGLFVQAAAVHAVCETRDFEQQPFTFCEVSVEQDLRLFLNDQSGQKHGSFGSINAQLASENKSLEFAMNAGMFHPDRQPVGLYIEGYQQVTALQDGGGYGNFGLAPNGVFCIEETSLSVFTRDSYEREQPNCKFATQSGPMLVIDGELHPRLIPDGTSKFYRNGVGVSADNKTAFFAISDRRVNFHDFARLFRDELKTPNALFFDGKVSRLYSPANARNDLGFPLGPIVGLVTDR